MEPPLRCQYLKMIVRLQKYHKNHTTIRYYISILKRSYLYLSMGDLQNPKMEVLYHIYKAYFSGLCKGISQQNMALYGTVPPF